MHSPTVALDFREETARPDMLRTRVWRGVSAEFVTIRGPSDYDFSWKGDTHYLALHDLKLIDGETRLEGAAPVHRLDLRGPMTFAPKDCRISGWSSVSSRANSYTALFYEPDMAREELDLRADPTEGPPRLYFDDSGLRSTLNKLRQLLLAPSDSDALYGETLGLLAMLEINRLQNRGAIGPAPESGRLSAPQERLLRDYIMDNLERNVSLSELAGLAQLSRFHFTRAFKKSFGLPPHQFLLHTRIERAKALLWSSDMPMARIAAVVGFGTPGQFSDAFRRATGQTPSQFRRRG